MSHFVVSVQRLLYAKQAHSSFGDCKRWLQPASERGTVDQSEVAGHPFPGVIVTFRRHTNGKGIAIVLN